MERVHRTLTAATGTRARCMYCADSLATDLEHFWPKTPYPARAFDWPNLLSGCSACNRLKGTRFPLDAHGQPLLIDPTSEDPWDFLFLDTSTGELAARFDPSLGAYDDKGQHTLEVIRTLEHEAVVEARGRTFRRLRRAVLAFMATAGPASAAIAREAEMLQEVQELDGDGVVCWCVEHLGKTSPPFSALAASYPGTWAKIAAQVNAWP